MSDLSLLPCPFCGGAAKVMDYSIDDELDQKPFFWVEHTGKNAQECPIKYDDALNGGMETCYFDSPEEAVASWNKRTS